MRQEEIDQVIMKMFDIIGIAEESRNSDSDENINIVTIENQVIDMLTTHSKHFTLVKNIMDEEFNIIGNQCKEIF